MSEPITYVGIDAHAAELQVALLAPEASTPVTWTVRNESRAVARLRRKLERAAAGPIACCYEAGPCGYALQRQLEGGRVCCQVIAPALVPRKPGERVKTDRRDARKLAELRAGLFRRFWDKRDRETMWEQYDRDIKDVDKLLKYGSDAYYNVSVKELRKPLKELLDKVFSRLYVLRNQLMHGFATAGGFMNRRQAQTGAAILDVLVPIFLDNMMDHLAARGETPRCTENGGAPG